MAQWLALLAVLSQALLPVAHAQLMARSGDHPLALFACGTGSADFVDALAALLPPELLALQNDDGAGTANGAFECPACAALSASGNGMAPSLAPLCVVGTAGIGDFVDQAISLNHARHALRPPVRAPPV